MLDAAVLARRGMARCLTCGTLSDPDDPMDPATVDADYECEDCEDGLSRDVDGDDLATWQPGDT